MMLARCITLAPRRYFDSDDYKVRYNGEYMSGTIAHGASDSRQKIRYVGADEKRYG